MGNVTPAPSDVLDEEMGGTARPKMVEHVEDTAVPEFEVLMQEARMSATVFSLACSGVPVRTTPVTLLLAPVWLKLAMAVPLRFASLPAVAKALARPT